MNNKIISFNEATRRVQEYKNEGKKVVLCYGVFWALHIGHIRYIKQAKKIGDAVVVVITPGNHADTEKRKYYESLRAEALAQLDWIDAVTVDTCSNFKEMVRRLRPDVYAKGFESVHSYDNSNHNSKEEEFFQNLGIQYIIVEEGDFSSSTQINQYLHGVSSDVLEYICLFKQRHKLDDIMRSLEKLQRFNVLVIGDTILDEYQYCSAIGKSSKDPTLVVKYQGSELFAGGALAVANNVANFAKRVDLVSVLGERDSYEEFIRSKLQSNISPLFAFKGGAPTLIKRRFVDGYSAQKLFEVYVMEDSFIEEDHDRKLCEIVCEKMHHYDLVVVADYGHGTISENMIDALTTYAPFLSVNTQSNAGNRGFNTITKYPKADYVSIAEHEIRLETRDLAGGILPMMSRLVRDLSTRQFVVTRGRKGCMVLSNQGEFVQVPSFAQNVVDRVGAGDAFFALTSMFSAVGVPNEVLGFVGNVIGSFAVKIMGNRDSIDKDLVKNYIYELLGDV